MSDFHEIHSGGQKHYQQQDLSWFLMKLFISFDTDQNLFLDTFRIKVNYLQYTEVPYVPMCFNLFNRSCSFRFCRETWAQLFLQVFFFWFFEKRHFQRLLRPIFDRDEQSKKNFLHYKPCSLTSLSSRKSWEIFALSIEKIEFLFFWYSCKKSYLNTDFNLLGQLSHLTFSKTTYF